MDRIKLELDPNYNSYVWPVYKYMTVEEKERIHAENQRLYNDFCLKMMELVPAKEASYVPNL